MASTGCSAFSQDGQYYAFCGSDGKLKIWETANGRLKHEYTPNRHLSSPWSVLEWISVSSQPMGNVSPTARKRRKRKSISEEADQKAIVAMGSVNGKITLYDIAAASVGATLENGHSTTVTAMTWSAYAGLITAADDYHIVEWNLQENGIKCKWKSGKAKVTALAILSNGKSLLSAERIIKWWNLATKQLIRTFTGHANQVTFLHVIKVNDTTNYLISGASADGHLSVWALDKHKNDKAPVTTLAMQDEATSVSTLGMEESQIVVLATIRSGQAQLFKYQPNGHSKPLKPSLSVAVAADISQKETVQQTPILAGQLTEDEKLLLAYGSYSNLTFEKVTPDFSDKVQCLIRSDAKKSKEKKEEAVSKVKSTAIEGNVEYLAPGMGVQSQKRNRTTSGSQLLLKDRLENLSLNTDANTPRRTPTKGANTQLLMQGLNSKDKTILATALFTKDETLIRNTIAKLPVQAITPLLKELTVMLQGKTYASKIAVMWLQALITTHAAHLMSRPDIAEILSPILSFIDAKLMLVTAIQRLRGRVSLITGQISQAKEEHNKDIMQESMLVYQDSDSSDEGADKDDVDLNSVNSESDENWAEMSDQDVQDEQDEEDIRSVKSEDNDVYDDDSIHS
ncbi:WD repeat-containing protein 43 [Linepithema humile]|uniref:WD repeat-containing protein 43 n=1 Tax=Linepithema humile TaxID=83485 RepID=UPI0006237EDB|nr:PREDICTED: WD repeat-containing protein 43 [Linepithema humile]